MWQQQQQNNGYSPAPRGQDFRNNTNKRPLSPSKRNNTSVNAYEYNQGKKLVNGTIDQRQSQSMDYDFRKKDFKPKNFYSSAKTTEPQSATKPDITNGEV